MFTRIYKPDIIVSRGGYMDPKNGWKSYLVMAAEESKYNRDHWFRYMRKFITEDGCDIPSSVIDDAMKSDVLTGFQKVTLKQALRQGSFTNRYVISLNKKAVPKMIKNLRRIQKMRSKKEAAFKLLNDKLINELIFEVGEELGLNTDNESWLNNSVSSLNKEPPIDICDKLYEYSNLIVYAVSLDYLLGMKLSSGREQDIKDAGNIISKEELTSPLFLVQELKEYGFEIDISLLLEAFGSAYGMDWLADYYQKHQEEIIDL